MAVVNDDSRAFVVLVAGEEHEVLSACAEQVGVSVEELMVRLLRRDVRLPAYEPDTVDDQIAATMLSRIVDQFEQADMDRLRRFWREPAE